ncbi:MAG: DUF362 domain-containing protein, partial [Firmicutes bacterium]|nr:DUF362 domain-containing protein [Bacillota bacterium]
MSAKVAVLKTRPETVLEDYRRLMKMAGVEQYLDKSRATILKNNISWHFPYPGANTTPWQLEGSILGLLEAGFEELVCVENKTVVTSAYKGEKLNKYMPVLQKYNVPVKYNFKKEDMQWIEYTPRGKVPALELVFPEGIRLPDYF